VYTIHANWSVCIPENKIIVLKCVILTEQNTELIRLMTHIIIGIAGIAGVL